MERCEPCGFGEFWWRMMQLSHMIDLIKPINDGFVINGHVLLNDIMQDHVFHLECTKITGDI